MYNHQYLITRFNSEDTNALADIDKSIKPGILQKLEAFLDDEKVVAFLLSVAVNEDEFDLGRIEAFKLFELKEYRISAIRHQVARVIREVLANSPDDQVRNYAAMAAANYIDIPEVASAIEQVLHDQQEDSDLRWNAFAAVQLNGPNPRSIDSLQRLLTDDVLKSSAARLLSEWREDA